MVGTRVTAETHAMQYLGAVGAEHVEGAVVRLHVAGRRGGREGLYHLKS